MAVIAERRREQRLRLSGNFSVGPYDSVECATVTWDDSPTTDPSSPDLSTNWNHAGGRIATDTISSDVTTVGAAADDERADDDVTNVPTKDDDATAADVGVSAATDTISSDVTTEQAVAGPSDMSTSLANTPFSNHITANRLSSPVDRARQPNILLPSAIYEAGRGSDNVANRDDDELADDDVTDCLCRC